MEHIPSYSDNLYADIQPSYTDSLMHHGIRGQKWGVRRYQNSDGSLTPEGKARYLKGKQTLINGKGSLQLTKDDKRFFYDRYGRPNQQHALFNKHQVDNFNKYYNDVDRTMQHVPEFKKLTKELDDLNKQIEQHEQEVFDRGYVDTDEFVKAMNDSPLYDDATRVRDKIFTVTRDTMQGRDWFDTYQTYLYNSPYKDAKKIHAGYSVLAQFLKPYM